MVKLSMSDIMNVILTAVLFLYWFLGGVIFLCRLFMLKVLLAVHTNFICDLVNSQRFKYPFLKKPNRVENESRKSHRGSRNVLNICSSNWQCPDVSSCSFSLQFVWA